MREAPLVRSIMRYARSQGCTAFKIPGSLYMDTGMPDVYMLVPVSYQDFAVPVHIEGKVPGKKPKPIQRKRLRDLQRAGAVAVWVDNLEDVKKLIQHIKDGSYVSVS